MKRQRYRERNRQKMSYESHEEYIQAINKSRQMKVSRGIEKSVKVGVEKKGCRQMLVSSMCQGKNHHIKNRSSIDRPSCREAIEETRAFLIDPPGVKTTIREKTWKLDRQPGVEEVLSKLLKTVFREEKNTDMNAIKHATQPMIQTPYKPFKIVSQQQF